MVRKIRLGKFRCLGHGAATEESRNACKILVEIHERKRQFGILRHR
jgi:hypothetical protein